MTEQYKTIPDFVTLVSEVIMDPASIFNEWMKIKLERKLDLSAEVMTTEDSAFRSMEDPRHCRLPDGSSAARATGSRMERDAGREDGSPERVRARGTPIAAGETSVPATQKGRGGGAAAADVQPLGATASSERDEHHGSEILEQRHPTERGTQNTVEEVSVKPEQQQEMIIGLQQQIADMGQALSQLMNSLNSPAPSQEKNLQPPTPEHSQEKSLQPTTAIPKLGRYDGTSSWEAYLFQFELVAAAAKWTDTQKAASLATALEGTARQALLDICHRDGVSYAEMLAALQRRFGEPVSILGLRDQLHQRCRQAKERLGVLAADVLRLASRAYPGLPPASVQSLALDAFLRGLRPSQLRQQVRLANPTTIEAALSRAEEIEDILMDGASAVAQHPVVRAASDVHESHPSVNAASTAATPAATPAQPRRCWNCGDTTHLRRDCKARRPTASGNGSGSA